MASARSFARAVLASSTLTVLVLSCLAPTQITVRLATDVDCAVVEQNGTALYPGRPSDVPPVSATRACIMQGTTHDIGSLVVTPSGDKDGALVLVAVTGVRRRSEDCAANDYKGCIVARRRVRFVPHERLELPIEMLTSCLDVPCSEDETCFRGACISAEVAAKNGCLGPDCEPRAGGVDAGDPRDVGVVDAVDASPIFDAIPPADAGGGVTVRLLHPTARVARGLAHSARRLVWTEPAAVGTTLLGVFDLDTNTFTSGEVPGEGWGVAASANEALLVGTFTTGCAMRVSLANFAPTAGANFTCPDAGTPLGAAARWPTAGPVAEVIVVLPTLMVRFGSDGGDAGQVAFGGGYAESGDSGAWVAVPNTVQPVPWAGIVIKAIPPSGVPSDTRGVAVTPTHYFVATATGQFVAIHRISGVVTEVLANTFASVEDLEWDEPRRALYVAATRVGAPGIYEISGLGTLP